MHFHVKIQITKIYLSKVLKILFTQPLFPPEVTRIDNLVYILPIPFYKITNIYKYIAFHMKETIPYVLFNTTILLINMSCTLSTISVLVIIYSSRYRII